MKTFSENNIQAFFELASAGLFSVHGRGVVINDYTNVDWSEIYKLAEEQSVVGLVTSGLDVLNVIISQEWRLQFIGASLQIEQRNRVMNEFVARLISMMRSKDVYTLLVKGQGVAQCYDKPLWRACGDIDFLLSEENYVKAKEILILLASDVEKEYLSLKHIGMTINGFVVELHGTLRSRLTKRIDNEIDKVQNECFWGGEVRSWQNGNTQVFLPGMNQDVIFVFTHILHHLFIEGIGLRQICDWCRLLWTFREKLDVKRLEKHLRAMRLMTEWKVLGCLVVEYLGMPPEAIPFYDLKYGVKASRLMSFILETGNFGHKRTINGESMLKTLCRRTRDAYLMMRIFPVDAWKMYFGMIRTGMVLRAE